MKFSIFKKKDKKAELNKIKEFPKIKDIMTRRVIYVNDDDPVGLALDKFASNGIRGMPVLNKDGKVVGVLHESDILDYINEHLDQSNHEEFEKQMAEFKKKPVREVMIKNPIMTSSDKDIEEAASLMYKHGVDRLPVVDNGKLVGIISRDDIIKGLTASKIAKKAKEENVKSVVDDILKLVNRKPNGITLDELASKLDADRELVNRWVSILEEHGVIEVDYTITGDKIIKKKKS